MRKADSPALPITEKAAVLWAATQTPEITVASHRFLKTGFRNASQIEVLVVAAFMSKEAASGFRAGSSHLRVFRYTLSAAVSALPPLAAPTSPHCQSRTSRHVITVVRDLALVIEQFLADGLLGAGRARFGLNFLDQRSEKCPIEIVRPAFKLRHLVEAAVF